MGRLFMDLIGLGCTAFRSELAEPLMTLAGYFGHGSVGSIVALSLLTHGYLCKNTRTKRAGFAVIIALILAGSAAAVLKEIVDLPRPRLRTSSGFPSGHTSAAFGLAAVLGVVFPSASPIFYLLAVLTGLSRLYFRAHFTWDVIGGAIIGIAAGLSVGRKLIGPARSIHRSSLRTLGWLSVSAIGIGVLIFFHIVERHIEAAISVAQKPNISAAGSMDFGTPEARTSLHKGWFDDELWEDSKLSIVWAGERTAELALALPIARDYHFRLTLFPYSPKGLVCQQVEVKLNGKSVASLFLEKGWHSYEFMVPSHTIRPGANLLQFSFDYDASPKARGLGSDPRRLSVAFDKLSVY
jgi:membrane-associated phospholipid phosphatase